MRVLVADETLVALIHLALVCWLRVDGTLRRQYSLSIVFPLQSLCCAPVAYGSLSTSPTPRRRDIAVLASARRRSASLPFYVRLQLPTAVLDFQSPSIAEQMCPVASTERLLQLQGCLWLGELTSRLKAFAKNSPTRTPTIRLLIAGSLRRRYAST